MKKIINGKRYNTDAAKEIGYFEENTTSSFDMLCESLYLKRTGEFFLAGLGGAHTKYGERSSDGWYGSGEGIEPITEAQAREWVEKHCDADTYEQLFDVVEDTAAADEIRSIRKSTGLTQIEFCEMYGIPRRTLQNWENAISVPAPYVVDLLKYRVEH